MTAPAEIRRTVEELLRLIDGGGYNFARAHVRSDLDYLHDLAAADPAGDERGEGT